MTAELVQTAVCGKSWGGRRGPVSVMKASLAEIVDHLGRQDIEDIWRFTIITSDGHHIRSAELRDLVRRSDLPDQD